LWSLAIEEQFYLVWPFVLFAGIWVFRKRSRLALMTLVLALIAAWWMAHLYHPGTDPTRAYEGTDTRAFGLLIGAALAMVWPARAVPLEAPRRRRNCRSRRDRRTDVGHDHLLRLSLSIRVRAALGGDGRARRGGRQPHERSRARARVRAAAVGGRPVVRHLPLV